MNCSIKKKRKQDYYVRPYRVKHLESETFQRASNSYCNVILKKPCAQSSLSLPQALILNQTHNSN